MKIWDEYGEFKEIDITNNENSINFLKEGKYRYEKIKDAKIEEELTESEKALLRLIIKIITFMILIVLTLVMIHFIPVLINQNISELKNIK